MNAWRSSELNATVAGTYDLMDIIALKVIERSKIPTRVVRSDISNIRDVVNGKDIGTKIVVIKKQS